MESRCHFCHQTFKHSEVRIGQTPLDGTEIELHARCWEKLVPCFRCHRSSMVLQTDFCFHCHYQPLHLICSACNRHSDNGSLQNGEFKCQGCRDLPGRKTLVPVRTEDLEMEKKE